jgi:hypothetical protein
VVDENDECSAQPNGSCDPSDEDGDGVLGSSDNCPALPNPEQFDRNGDGIGDECSLDRDSDGVDDSLDSCPRRWNPLQAEGFGGQLWCP